MIVRTSRTVALIQALVLAFLVNDVRSALDLYPWGSKDYYDRSDELLASLRKNMVLEIVGDAIKSPFLLSPSLTSSSPSETTTNAAPVYDREMLVKNHEGAEFVITVSTAAKENEKKKKEAQALLLNPDYLNKKLDGFCSVLPMDYWNYEWCHRNEIRQFHVDYKPNTNKMERKPDWSLGKYIRTITVRTEIGNDESPIAKIVDYYEGGQICHENNQLRRTEVHIQCCAGMEHQYPNAVKASNAGSNSHENGGDEINTASSSQAVLSHIIEPDMCSYEAIVCSPLLCAPTTTTAAPAATDSTVVSSPNKGESSSSKTNKVAKTTSSSSSGEITLLEAMRVINATCLLKQEEWWTYELCFGKGVRQIRFEIAQSVNSEGALTQKQVIANQYYLGYPHLENYKIDSALQDRVGNKDRNLALTNREKEIFATSGLLSPLFRARGRSRNFLRLEFSNGTACDLDNMNRSSVVEIYCGPSNSFYQLREESTCKYLLRAEMPVLCNVPGFQLLKETPSSIHFHPLHPEQFEDSLSVDSTDSSKAIPDDNVVQEEEIVSKSDEILTSSMSSEQELLIERLALAMEVDALAGEGKDMRSTLREQLQGQEAFAGLAEDVVEQLLVQLEKSIKDALKNNEAGNEKMMTMELAFDGEHVEIKSTSEIDLDAMGEEGEDKVDTEETQNNKSEEEQDSEENDSLVEEIIGWNGQQLQ